MSKVPNRILKRSGHWSKSKYDKGHQITTIEIENQSVRFHPIKEISTLLRHGQQFIGTLAYTVRQLELLLQRAAENRYPNIKMFRESVVNGNSGDKSTDALDISPFNIQLIQRKDDPSSSICVNSGFPINNIIVKIETYGLYFSLIAEQNASYDGTELNYYYSKYIWIDKFALLNWVPDMHMDVQNIYDAIYDFCTKPTSLEMSFHIIDSQVVDSLGEMRTEFGEIFLNKIVPTKIGQQRQKLLLEYNELDNQIDKFGEYVKGVDDSIDLAINRLRERMRLNLANQAANIGMNIDH